MAETKTAVSKFEVVRTVNLGKGVIRRAGDTVLASELPAKDLEEFLKTGTLRDADAPIPPSQAAATREHDRVIAIAKELGLVKQNGGDYTFGDKTAKGLAAFREVASIDELHKAIVNAVKR